MSFKKTIHPLNAPPEQASSAAADTSSHATPTSESDAQSSYTQNNTPTPPRKPENQHRSQPSVRYNASTNIDLSHKPSTAHPVVKLLLSYLLGAFLVVIGGYIAGIIIGPFLLSTSVGKFSELDNTLRLLFSVAPVSFIFFLVGSLLRYRWAGLYPFIVFLFGTTIPLPAGIMFYLPESISYVGIHFAFAYASVHATVWPIIALIKYSKKSSPQHARPIVITAISIMVLSTFLSGATWIGAYALTAKAARAIAFVPQANTDEFFTSFWERGSSEEPQLTLFYADEILTSEGSYQPSTEVETRAAGNAWQKNDLSSCKNGGEQKTTKGGRRYLHSSSRQNKFGDPELKSGVYVSHSYCFTVDHTTFTFEQNDRNGPKLQEKYPAETIIDAFDSSKAVNIACFTDWKGNRPLAQKGQCSLEDERAWDQLNNLAKERRRRPAPNEVKNQVIPLYVRADAYETVEWLKIPELGLEIPIAKEIAGSTYKRHGDHYEVQLPSITRPSCSAPIRVPREDPYTIGYFTKITAEDMAKMSSGTTKHSYFNAVRPVVDGVAYHIKPPLTLCMNNMKANISIEQGRIYEDIFLWSLANGRATSD